jgi:hypothetical protein
MNFLGVLTFTPGLHSSISSHSENFVPTLCFSHSVLQSRTSDLASPEGCAVVHALGGEAQVTASGEAQILLPQFATI